MYERYRQNGTFDAAFTLINFPNSIMNLLVLPPLLCFVGTLIFLNSQRNAFHAARFHIQSNVPEHVASDFSIVYPFLVACIRCVL